jgi:hypothetical protein
MRDVGAASEVMKPFDARLMRCYPVSSRVNSVANDDARCSAPVEFAEAQARLFLVCRACSTAWRCKSSSQRDGREVIAKRNGEITLAARRGRKEARSKDASR